MHNPFENIIRQLDKVAKIKNFGSELFARHSSLGHFYPRA